MKSLFTDIIHSRFLPGKTVDPVSLECGIIGLPDRSQGIGIKKRRLGTGPGYHIIQDEQTVNTDRIHHQRIECVEFISFDQDPAEQKGVL